MARYAENTTVPTERSRGEIEATLARYGASSFAYGWDAARALIEFVHEGRRVRFILPLPDRAGFATKVTRVNQHDRGTVVAVTPTAQANAWEQACRQRWRALALAVKAKLEAVEAEISTFEEEFLAHIVLPDNTTVGEWARPQLAAIAASGQMPALLPGSAA